MKRKFLVSTAIATLFGFGALLAGSALADESLQDVLKRRNLSEKDLLAAAKTYTPSGGRDEFIAFSSSGHAGQIIVYGIPSMRILKYIGVFTPEPWQGYGFDDESKRTTPTSPRPTATMTASGCSSTTNRRRASPLSA